MSVDVLLASGSFWPREGGAERQMRQVLAACARGGLTCAVVTQVLEGQPRRAEVDGVQVLRVGSNYFFRHMPRLGQLIWGVAEATQVLRMRPRIAVSTQMGVASLAVAVVRRVSKMGQVVRLTGGGTASFRSEPWVRRSTRGGRLVVRLVVQGNVLLVSPAKHLLNDFAEAFPEHGVATQIIPNGVTQVAPERLPADSSRSGVVWYARGGSVNSIEAFTRIVQECPDLPFLAIGHTDDLPEGGSLRRLGWVKDPVEVMAGARVMLNTSPTEGMPNTALQALATGMAVVGPANEGLRELAERFPDRVSLVDLSNSRTAADALRRAYAARVREPAEVISSNEVAKLWKKLFAERMKQ